MELKGIIFKYYNLCSGVSIYTVTLGMWLICEKLKVVYMYLSNYYDKIIFFSRKIRINFSCCQSQIKIYKTTIQYFDWKKNCKNTDKMFT